MLTNPIQLIPTLPLPSLSPSSAGLKPYTPASTICDPTQLTSITRYSARLLNHLPIQHTIRHVSKGCPPSPPPLLLCTPCLPPWTKFIKPGKKNRSYLIYSTLKSTPTRDQPLPAPHYSRRRAHSRYCHRSRPKPPLPARFTLHIHRIGVRRLVPASTRGRAVRRCCCGYRARVLSLRFKKKRGGAGGVEGRGGGGGVLSFFLYFVDFIFLEKRR